MVVVSVLAKNIASGAYLLRVVPILIFLFQTCASCLNSDSCESQALEDLSVCCFAHKGDHNPQPHPNPHPHHPQLDQHLKSASSESSSLFGFHQKKDNVGEEGDHTQGPVWGKYSYHDHQHVFQHDHRNHHTQGPLCGKILIDIY